MNLEKKIVYIDYIENGEKLKNAGHIKLWLRDDSCILDIHIKGLYQTDTMMAEMRGIGRDSVIGRICIDKGTAYFNGSFPADNLDGNGSGFNDLEGICIRLSENRALEARWENGTGNGGRAVTKQPITRQPGDLKAASTPCMAEGVEAADDGGRNAGSDVVQFPYKTTAEVPGEAEEQLERPELERFEQEQSEPGPSGQEAVLFPDKWEQLCHTYPLVHPFTTQDYLKIEPRDFTILRKEYQQLVNNSFLLHGFYNYRHLILGKERKREREVYYLGVPGTYYEREKMVAVMFGFESFEVSEQEFSQGFIPEGTFGYYLRTVEI